MTYITCLRSFLLCKTNFKFAYMDGTGKYRHILTNPVEEDIDFNGHIITNAMGVFTLPPTTPLDMNQQSIINCPSIGAGGGGGNFSTPATEHLYMDWKCIFEVGEIKTRELKVNRLAHFEEPGAFLECNTNLDMMNKNIFDVDYIETKEIKTSETFVDIAPILKVTTNTIESQIVPPGTPLVTFNSKVAMSDDLNMNSHHITAGGEIHGAKIVTDLIERASPTGQITINHDTRLDGELDMKTNDIKYVNDIYLKKLQPIAGYTGVDCNANMVIDGNSSLFVDTIYNTNQPEITIMRTINMNHTDIKTVGSLHVNELKENTSGNDIKVNNDMDIDDNELKNVGTVALKSQSSVPSEATNAVLFVKDGGLHYRLGTFLHTFPVSHIFPIAASRELFNDGNLKISWSFVERQMTIENVGSSYSWYSRHMSLVKNDVEIHDNGEFQFSANTTYFMNGSTTKDGSFGASDNCHYECWLSRFVDAPIGAWRWTLRIDSHNYGIGIFECHRINDDV